jgi:hypothetical protein
MTDKSQFDASASMLGYLYQVRFALYFSLKKLPEVDDPEQFNVSIEKLDDIAFDKEGSAIELLQTKFHGTPGNLTNRSTDFWKTVRVWVESIKKGDIELGKTVLTLLTTQALPSDTIAFYLSCDQSRNPSKALELMSKISKEENVTNSKGYTAFLSLSDIQKQALVDSIYVLGKSDDLLGIRLKICRYGRQSVPPESVEAFVDRLEGVWFKWCVEALSQTPLGLINLGVIQDLIDKLRPEYTATNLPAEFTHELPDVIELDQDVRIFVQQLHLFNAPKTMIEQAIIYYYRAFEQRTKWSIDGLLRPGELSKFDQRLCDAWKDQQAYLEIMADINSEEGKRKYSAELYHHCLQHGVIPIRPDFLETYVAKGSYHLLSDQLKIGWHPEFLNNLGNACNEDAA